MGSELRQEGDREPRLIVGIGASAGGLAACKRLLGAMPSDAGLALVIVVHLDPHHESQFAELLRASTRMAVIQAEERRLEPDCVYVIAPNTSLEIRDGRLLTKGPRQPHEAFKPVDELFASLAQDRGAKAIAIVLSGVGNDGSMGLRDVKARGGLCLAQAPESAEYDGMPTSAIATGAVDHVLEPEQMSELLVEYATDPETVPRARSLQELAPSPAFDEILDLLGHKYGVDFRKSYKTGAIERRATRRRQLRQMPDWPAYLELLGKDRAEVGLLYRDLLIGVTPFFRDPEVWRRLEHDFIPQMLRQQRDVRVPLRVWVPGCATGEEPYSVAIALLEAIARTGGTRKLQIFASDVADDALATARKGRYSGAIREALSPERLLRFFRNDGDDFVVSRELRDAVTFASHNLLVDPPFSGVDLVSCRNTLIYLEAGAQQRVLQDFHFALKPGGLLLLGASETVGRQGGLFVTLSPTTRIYQSTASTDRARHKRLQWARTLHPLRAPTEALASTGGRVTRLVEQLILSKHVSACVVLNESFEIQSFFGPTREYLAPPVGDARMNLLAWTKPGLYPKLRPALEAAREGKGRILVTGMRMDGDGVERRVEGIIEPIQAPSGEAPLYLVAFRDEGRAATADESPRSEMPVVGRLEAELESSREELQSVIEQLAASTAEHRASHEELLSLNEELQSNNEELEASKEELQSLNEEMATINRQVEEKNRDLRSLNADLNNLLASAAIPIVFLDRELRVRRFTPATAGLMRIVASDVGRAIEHIKQRVVDPTLVADARRVLEKLVPVVVEVQTEDHHWYERSIRPYRTEEDRIDGVCIAFLDVTERKRAAQQVDEARVYAEAIVETVRTPLLVLDGELRILSANSAFLEAFRLPKSQVKGSLLYELGNGAWDIPRLRQLLETILPRHEAVDGYEIEHPFQQLGVRSLLVNARRMNRGERAPLILIALEDITLRKRAEREAEARNVELGLQHRRKDEFLAMLGHELRNPLAALQYGIELMAPHRDAALDVERIRGMMARQSRQMATLLDQLLDAARLTAARFEIARVPLDLAAAVQLGIETATPIIEARHHELSVTLPPRGEVCVEGDPARLAQVITNLLTNAAKYTDEGGNISLSIFADEHWSTIRVRDTGIGMSSELLPRIFDVFTQGPRTLERSGGGLGLGLPVVKRLVELHEGTVAASSPGRGLGSEFVVRLPVRRQPLTDMAEAPRTAVEGSRRILVVDDVEDNALVLAELLRMKNHDVRVAYDGPGALEVAREFGPDAIVLDLGLPLMDGFEVAERLRRENAGKTMLLVALSGYQEDPGRLAQAGFDRALLKPAALNELLECLDHPGSRGPHRNAEPRAEL